MKKLLLSFIATVTILGIIIILFLTSGHQKAKDFGFELAKLSTQLILIVVFGGILIQEYNRKRERKQALNDFRKMILRELIRAYADAKKARRLLRAKCVSKANDKNEDVGEIPYVVYEEQIHNINDVQLRLEILVDEIDTFKEAFTNEVKLKEQLDTMEKYLRRLISEYEKISSTNGHLECIPLARLNRLSHFIRRGTGTEKSQFGKEFTPVFLKSLELIRAESLKA